MAETLIARHDEDTRYTPLHGVFACTKGTTAKPGRKALSTTLVLSIVPAERDLTFTSPFKPSLPPVFSTLRILCS
jgi:hypothetical protein